MNAYVLWLTVSFRVLLICSMINVPRVLFPEPRILLQKLDIKKQCGITALLTACWPYLDAVIVIVD